MEQMQQNYIYSVHFFLVKNHGIRYTGSNRKACKSNHKGGDILWQF